MWQQLQAFFTAENSIWNFYDPVHTEGLLFKAVGKKLTTHFQLTSVEAEQLLVISN